MPDALSDQRDRRMTAWRHRIDDLGIDRAVVSRASDSPSALQAVQYRVVWPCLLAALNGTERRALDFGCGTGRWTPALADLVGYALGVDFLPEFVAYAEAHRPVGLGPDRLAYEPCMYGQIPAPDGAFDLLWACMVLDTIVDEPMLQETLTEWRRVLRPGALVVVTDSTSRDNGRPIRNVNSTSRTVGEYQGAFRWASARPVARYVDHHEVNTVFVGRVHA